MTTTTFSLKVYSDLSPFRLEPVTSQKLYDIDEAIEAFSGLFRRSVEQQAVHLHIMLHAEFDDPA